MMVATIRTCARMIALAWLSVAPALADSPRPSIAMHGAPALPDDFDHWPYANTEAPMGGRLTLAYLGSFDSLNPFNVKALSTSEGLIGNVYQSLMARSIGRLGKVADVPLMGTAFATGAISPITLAESLPIKARTCSMASIC